MKLLIELFIKLLPEVLIDVAAELFKELEASLVVYYLGSSIS